ncbi:hypothetical protein TrVFT333_002391 [Trichoderma virens FT-333]|nr:hypothetical protein TrVFT333_002391 [Trichoderma virens FT-333]
MYFATNVYGWTLLAERDGHDWDLDRAMAEAKIAGVRGWEHAFRSASEVQAVADAAARQSLEMHTAYVFGAFHEPELAKAAIENALEIADALRAVGVRNLIINPDPLPQGALKTDAQLYTQSIALQELGAALSASGSRLLYHTHDPEMKGGAREFHNMMVNSDPASVGLCLDVHWVYRGAGNSQTAVHDIITLYADRISLLHLRQSVNGVWSETISSGDIDYPVLIKHLEKNHVKSLMTIELAMEAGTPAELSGVKAHQLAIQYLEPLLSPVALEPTSNLEAPWRIYLFGAGAIARLHAAAAKKLDRYQLFAADPSNEARESFSKAFPHAKVFEDAEVMLASSPAQGRDIVVVAVPPWLHHSAALASIRSKRHVLCEKPVALSQAELDDLLAAARNTGRHFGDCSVRFLCNDALGRAREIVSSGGIGSPYHARLVNRNPRIRPGIEFQPESKWFLDKTQAGGGISFDWGVYDLSMLFDVLRPVAVHVHHAYTTAPPTGADPPDCNITVESHVGAAMSLELENGATVALDFERASGFHGESQSILNVDGSTGGLSWEWCPPFENDSVQLMHYVDVAGKVEKRLEQFPAFGWDEVHGRPLLAFVDLVAGRDSVILPARRLAFNYAVLLAIYQCAADGKPVDVHLKS